MKQIILQCVNEGQGIKEVNLALKVMTIVNPVHFVIEEYAEGLIQLVAEGEIIEFEYVLPELNYKTKSIYFPKGTIFGPSFNEETTNRNQQRRPSKDDSV